MTQAWMTYGSMAPPVGRSLALFHARPFRRHRTCLDDSLINRLLKIFDFLPGSQDVKVFTTFGALYEATPIIVALLDVLNQLSSLVGCHGPSIFALPSQSL